MMFEIFTKAKEKVMMVHDYIMDKLRLALDTMRKYLKVGDKTLTIILFVALWFAVGPLGLISKALVFAITIMIMLIYKSRK